MLTGRGTLYPTPGEWRSRLAGDVLPCAAHAFSGADLLHGLAPDLPKRATTRAGGGRARQWPAEAMQAPGCFELPRRFLAPTSSRCSAGRELTGWRRTRCASSPCARSLLP